VSAAVAAKPTGSRNENNSDRQRRVSARYSQYNLLKSGKTTTATSGGIIYRHSVDAVLRCGR
jgi:hypothetical protein